jgi:hypothetical protein
MLQQLTEMYILKKYYKPSTYYKPLNMLLHVVIQALFIIKSVIFITCDNVATEYGQ